MRDESLIYHTDRVHISKDLINQKLHKKEIYFFPRGQI